MTLAPPVKGGATNLRCTNDGDRISAYAMSVKGERFINKSFNCPPPAARSGLRESGGRSWSQSRWATHPTPVLWATQKAESTPLISGGYHGNSQ